MKYILILLLFIAGCGESKDDRLMRNLEEYAAHLESNVKNPVTLGTVGYLGDACSEYQKCAPGHVCTGPFGSDTPDFCMLECPCYRFCPADPMLGPPRECIESSTEPSQCICSWLCPDCGRGFVCSMNGIDCIPAWKKK
jgi:hypothetical protein